MSDILEAADAIEADETETKRALRRALRKLDEAKAKKAELVEAVYAAARDAASAMEVPPVPKVKPRKSREDDPEAAVVLMADWQWGKLTPQYDSEIAKQRVERFTDKALRIIDYVRAHHPVPEVHVLYLGDLVEGELIFSGQAHRIDASLYRQTFEVAEAIANQLRRFVAHVDTVKAEGVIGNHGAFGGSSRREMHPETNADAMAMNTARLILGDSVEFPEPVIEGERAWYAIHEVLGRRWFMAHGDQVKGASFGIPWYGFGKKIQGWYMTLGPFDYVATGHWHQALHEDINGIEHFAAGSTEAANTYAQEYLAGGGQQGSQWLIFQNAERITSQHKIRL